MPNMLITNRVCCLSALFILLNSCTRDWNHPFLADVTTVGATEITMFSAVLSGKVLNTGGSTLSEIGICYGLFKNPTIETNKIELSIGIENFGGTVTGLASGTLYYARAYAINDMGVSYGNQISFTTLESTLSDGLVAYYPFNGNANDESGNGNDATVYGGAIFVPDRFSNNNSAYNLDGIDDYINIGKNVKPNLPISVSLWFVNNGAMPMLFCNDQLNSTSYYHGFWLIGDLQVGIGSGYASSYSRKSIGTTTRHFETLGKWHHVVAIINSANEMYLYVDGVECAATFYGTGNKMTYSSNDGLIGKRLAEGYTCGIIDDIRVYNKRLTKEDVLALFYEASK